MNGLKKVRTRRADALAHVAWDELESMLAAHYRGQGYAVDHCGTAGTGARFDGGIDLKLRKDAAYILVQCKHWNARQVPHNDVHQLIGLMVNEGASGAILVTSGEFTRAAIEAANRHGHVRLVDGDALRALLGPLPARPRAPSDGPGGAPRAPRRRGPIATAMGAGLWLVVLKLLVALVMVLGFTGVVHSVIRSLVHASRTPAVQPAGPNGLPVPQEVAAGGLPQQLATSSAHPPELIDHYTGTTIQDSPSGTPSGRRPTPDDIRESQRRADAAARIIEANTPEM